MLSPLRREASVGIARRRVQRAKGRVLFTKAPLREVARLRQPPGMTTLFAPASRTALPERGHAGDVVGVARLRCR